MPTTGKRNPEHLDVRPPQTEMDLLRLYCEQTQRSQSDVFREFIRSLQVKILADDASISPEKNR